MDSKLVHRYFSFVEDISEKYGYDSNIKHLLFLIIPAFVKKYSIHKENLILNTFRSVKIIISKEKNDLVEAYYTSIPSYDNGKIITNKYIVIQNYENISLVQLLDNLVHEFNHAVNSYQKEIVIRDNTLFLRTGLTYASYSIPRLEPIKKDDSYVLEEILNTSQTESIIDVIKEYSGVDDDKIYATVYSINHETDDTYTSKSYYLENTIFRPILDNRTFLSTLNNLRISGDIEDIEDWFNHITGIDNSYNLLNQYLKEMMELEEELGSKKLFRGKVINKIRDLIATVTDIINIFNQNCGYK